MPEKVPRPQPTGVFRRRDRAILIGLAVAVVTFSAVSLAVNALRPDVPTTSNSTAIDPRAQDSDYIVHLGGTILPGFTQTSAIALGRNACARLDAGDDRADVRGQLMQQKLTPAQADSVIAAAAIAYCPSHR